MLKVEFHTHTSDEQFHAEGIGHRVGLSVRLIDLTRDGLTEVTKVTLVP